MSKYMLYCASLLFCNASVLAQQVDYNYIELGHQTFDFADDSSGFSFAAMGRNHSIYWEAQVDRTKDESGYHVEGEFNESAQTIKHLRFGVGHVVDLNNHSVIDFGVQLGRYTFEHNVKYKNEFRSANNIWHDHADIYGARLQYQHVLAGKWETKLGIGFEHISGEGLGDSAFVLVGFGYRFNSNLTSNLQYRDAGDYTSTELNLRFVF
ncbi:hypothetical protein [Pseudoalteromonas viridis]|uniref:Outer membrane protein beta-barrel domain-containing protein n=1 Tax=Pseudoalteromonas viridis TaxID=339617 RepID=A0ABX7VAY6_9GAMM|nr:hypothetical protein [Pseudoalteromonas viridis]QTL36946.1 hypothetical protein J5X90_07980 [Pseudoalteromonas viridis]